MLRTVNTLVFLLLMLAGLAILLLRLGGDTAALVRQMRQVSWLDGSVTALLDKQVARALPDSHLLDGWLHGALYAATGDADPQVRQGCPGWLFLNEEIVTTPHGGAHMRQRLRLAEFLHAQFQRRGIALLMLPVPDKVEQARAQLCGLAVPAQAASRRQAWRAASSALDLPQIDIGPDWPPPGYWRTDSHWDRGGAAFAAAKVAQGVLATATLTPGATVIKEQWGPQQPPQARTGDLARLAKLERNHPPFAPPREYEQALNLDIERGGALFDDTAAPQVLLAGSSYSLNSGFIDYLQLKLGQEVSQQSRVGSGFAGSLLDLLRHPARLDGVKVVVWEWPLRVLYQPLTDDEISHLKQQGDTP